jgi:hypothetical protein
MKNLIYILITVLLITSCKTVKLTNRPSPGIANEIPLIKESKVFIPFEINLNDIQAMVEKEMPKGLIYRKNQGCEREEYKVKVYRNKPVTLTSSNGKLIFKTILDVNANGKYCAGAWVDNWSCDCCCVGANPSGSANSEVEVKIEVDLKINENYEVTADTKLDGKIISGKFVKINLLGFKISIPVEEIAGPIKDKLKPIEKTLNAEITKELQKIDLKKELELAWNEAHKTIPVDNFNLHINPQSIFFQNIYSSDNLIKLGVGISTKLNLKSSNEEIPLKPLPNLSIVDSSEEGTFFIHLPTDANFTKISNVLNKEYKDKKFENGNNWVKIKNINLYGVKINENSSGILIEVAIKGKLSLFKRVKGNIYFTAKPALDTDKKIVYLDDFKMNSNTNSELINKGVEYLINNFYYEDISKESMYNYAEDLTNLEKKVRTQLKEIKIGDFNLKLNLEKIIVEGLYITDKVIGINAEANGGIETIRLKE